MKYDRLRGSTSNMVRVFIPDNTSTTGKGLTGLTNASTNLAIAYLRELDNAATVYSGANIEAQATIGTYQAPSTSSKVRFKEVDATNFPGVYEIQFHNSATIFGTADASRNVQINVVELTTTALKIGPNLAEIRLIAWDMQTALSATLVQANVTQWLGQAVQATVNGIPQVDLKYLLGTALTESVAGYLAAGLKKLLDVAAPVFTLASINQTGDTFAKFAGITLLANWLRGLARSSTMDATAKTELNSGGGTYDEATDSQEAIRDTAPLGTAMRGTDNALLASSYIAPPSAVTIAGAVLDEPGAGHTGLIPTNLDAQVSSLVPGSPIQMSAEITEVHIGP